MEDKPFEIFKKLCEKCCEEKIQIYSYLKKFHKPLLTLILLSLSPAANSQTIADKKFTKTNSPVFVANGFVNFSAANGNQSSSFENSKLPDGFSRNNFSNPDSIGNDTQVFLKSGVKLESGAKYGVVAKFEMNRNLNRFNEKPNLDQAFLYSESDSGKFEFGNNQAVNQKMKVGPARLARGAGGINGKYLEHVNLPMLANSSQSSSAACSGGVGSAACANIKLPQFILLAQSPIGHGGGAKSFYSRANSANYSANSSSYSAFDRSNFRALKDDSFDGMEDATKISYYSPRIEGLQLGASYAPSSNNIGFTKQTALTINTIRIENIFSFAANYSQNFDNLEVAISATAEKGQVRNARSTYGVSHGDLFSYDLGATLSYFGFTLGASYGSWGSSLMPKNGIYSCNYNSSQNLSAQNCSSNAEKFSDPHYYSGGISYQFGPIAASVTGIKTTYQKNDYQAVSLGLDYKLTRDLMPYFEVTKFEFKSNQVLASDVVNQSSVSSSQNQTRDNQGYVFLTGILYSF